MHNRWHPDIEAAVHIAPGDQITLDVRDGVAGDLTRYSTHEDVARIDLGLSHPLAGPVYVEGAAPGDLLEIEFIAYETADFGFTPMLPGIGLLDDVVLRAYLVKWEIADGHARTVELPGVAVPGDPFAGVAGVTPSAELMAEFRAREERIRASGGRVADDMPDRAFPRLAAAGLRTIPPRETGGNLDVRGLVAGSRLRLPVHVEGALFSVGDLHFAQGDGEVSGAAIEIAGRVTVGIELRIGESARLRFPCYETPPRPGRPAFATTGLPVSDAMDLTVAAQEALREMISWLVETRGFAPEPAYALCSACVDLRISQAVNVPYPLVSAVLPLDVFAD